LCKIPENPSADNRYLPASQDLCRRTGQDCWPIGGKHFAAMFPRQGAKPKALHSEKFQENFQPVS
jgi:hypothetical protein